MHRSGRSGKTDGFWIGCNGSPTPWSLSTAPTESKLTWDTSKRPQRGTAIKEINREWNERCLCEFQRLLCVSCKWNPPPVQCIWLWYDSMYMFFSIRLVDLQGDEDLLNRSAQLNQLEICCGQHADSSSGPKAAYLDRILWQLPRSYFGPVLKENFVYNVVVPIPKCIKTC